MEIGKWWLPFPLLSFLPASLTHAGKTGENLKNPPVEELGQTTCRQTQGV